MIQAEDVIQVQEWYKCDIPMNPFLSFLFMNMENHIEHHIYPMVPFHALPQLHKRVADQLPKTYSSMWQGSKELIPALLKQRKDPTYYIKRELPQSPSTA